VKLTLSRAILENRLTEFVAQSEAEGVGEASQADFDEAPAATD
jgi:hypothetical protein